MQMILCLPTFLVMPVMEEVEVLLEDRWRENVLAKERGKEDVFVEDACAHKEGLTRQLVDVRGRDVHPGSVTRRIALIWLIASSGPQWPRRAALDCLNEGGLVVAHPGYQDERHGFCSGYWDDGLQTTAARCCSQTCNDAGGRSLAFWEEVPKGDWRRSKFEGPSTTGFRTAKGVVPDFGSVEAIHIIGRQRYAQDGWGRERALLHVTDNTADLEASAEQPKGKPCRAAEEKSPDAEVTLRRKLRSDGPLGAAYDELVGSVFMSSIRPVREAQMEGGIRGCPEGLGILNSRP
ncbi:hypothetical protein B0H17DRAFT_1236191 [Mycena rosella]|uniref:Uncharacterized protein n=1 Tax=Mycena rosella TaxID=1033263 RepID=A0AAD7D4M3_MYCRO|nr:hypothetical protein B0H17DRAFT_1236191 [Mycena rosella]